MRYNANPEASRVGDCVIRAISKATGQTWEQTYVGVCVMGFRLCDMPSADYVWAAYLVDRGYERCLVETGGSLVYTVDDFCRDHPKGTYILAISGHVVCVIDGCYYDTWDSGDEIPIYYWQKKED